MGGAPPLVGLARGQLNSPCLIVSERVPRSGGGMYYFYPVGTSSYPYLVISAGRIVTPGEGDERDE